MTNEHHQSRNFVLHQGKHLYIPKTERNTLKATELAKRVGIEDPQVITYVEILLAPYNKNALLIKMDDEIRQLENHFLELFDKLLPIYRSNHHLYSS